MFEVQPYTPPAWAAKLGLVPAQRCRLAQLPTPVHPWPVPGLPCELHIKRDDLTGMQLSGNKARSGRAAWRSSRMRQGRRGSRRAVLVALRSLQTEGAALPDACMALLARRCASWSF